MRRAVMLITLALAGAGCGAGRAALDLERAAADYWEAHLDRLPVHATVIGVKGRDGRLEDITPEGRARDRARLEEILERARAVPERDLDAAGRLTRSSLITQIEGDLALLDCRLDEWLVSPMDGPQVSLLNLESFQPLSTPADAAAMLERWRAIAPFIDAWIANLRRGLAEAKAGVRDSVERVISQLEEILARPDEEWPLLKPLRAGLEGWSAAERERFRADLRSVVGGEIRPAFARALVFLRSEALPAARPPERAGVLHLPGGSDCYRRLIRVHTSLDLAPEEVHRIGQEEVARINREMRELGERALGVAERSALLERLRRDPALYFTTRDEVEAKARAALERAQAAVPRWFGIQPRAACEVARMEAHEEKHSTIAYYREPAVDGSRPGRYYINTYAPETRPRYEAEALAWHEAVPGHHLQIAISQELEGLPAFRRHLGVTAFVEGWALYAERLADEMGLYSSDVDRIGMLSYDAWRACRLVVDTGMHALGWTRRQAIDFMRENSALAENNIVNEVDRYINWPGQALGYKIGQLEILRLREEARRRLGERFDLKAFHDAVLRHGAIALGPLREQIEAHISAAASR